MINRHETFESYNLSFYDLGGEDHYIFAELCGTREVAVTVENENGQQVYYEKSHIYAWESLVCFAKMILSQNDKIQKKLAQID
jgi:hypothetical protein